EETLKAGCYVSWSVKSLVTLEQGGGINLSSLEAQLETLLESVVTFNPPGELYSLAIFRTDSINHLSEIFPLPWVHFSLCRVGVSAGEALAAYVITWLDRKGRGCPILPLLTACSRCLASVRHMTRIMEACITAYFNHGDEAKLFLWWHKALNLSVEQLQPQAGNTEVSGVVMGLLRLQNRLLQLGEDRLNSGLLGAIGLGKRSPVSNK
ncbi:hypothetical protein XENOCAPTIV_004652, partial [Xenoophorus captivus]